MAFSTTINRKYWDLKMEDLAEFGYFYEHKSEVPYWRARLDNLQTPCAAVFLVGREVHRLEVENIEMRKIHQVPKRYRDALSSYFSYALKIVEPKDGDWNG